MLAGSSGVPSASRGGVSLGGMRWKSQASPGERSRLSACREWVVAKGAEKKKKKKKSPSLIGLFSPTGCVPAESHCRGEKRRIPGTPEDKSSCFLALRLVIHPG